MFLEMRYPIRLWHDIHSSPWKFTIFKFGKPSISMGHLYHGELLVITRWYDISIYYFITIPLSISRTIQLSYFCSYLLYIAINYNYNVSQCLAKWNEGGDIWQWKVNAFTECVWLWNIRWMEEILHHRKDGWNPINNGTNQPPINWCRISCIHSMKISRAMLNCGNISHIFRTGTWRFWDANETCGIPHSSPIVAQ